MTGEYKKITECLLKPTFNLALTEGYIYQYRTFESFWQIIQSDKFWATDARFLNDLEEQHMGIKHMCKELEENIEDNLEDLEIGESYIVCFCSEDDILSQWRGYAPGGGVSIGFDFRTPIPFSILSKNQVQGSDDSLLSNDSIWKVCLGVYYLDPSPDCDELSILCGTDIVKREDETLKKRMRHIVPYIKHSGFREEKECRLVFRHQDFHEENCVQYQYNPTKILKIPYIPIRPGNIAYQTKSCCVRAQLSDDDFKSLKNELNALPDVEIISCLKNEDKNHDEVYDDKMCFGCSQRIYPETEIGVNGKPGHIKCKYKHNFVVINERVEDQTNGNSYLKKPTVMISQGNNQEKLFNQVHKWAKNLNKEKKDMPKIKVWCEGHLPIRSITIGPCPNIDEMYESIRHYCANAEYWLRDVEIKRSEIPFRETIK